MIRIGKGNFIVIDENRFERAIGVLDRGIRLGFLRFGFWGTVPGEVGEQHPPKYNKTVILKQSHRQFSLLHSSITSQCPQDAKDATKMP